MRVLLMAHGWGGWRTTQWLREQHVEIVALVVHPPDNRRFFDEIAEAAALDEGDVIQAPHLREAETVARLRDLAPDIAITSFFGYILKPGVIEIPTMGCVNIHPSYLPYNRGWHSNVWPILDGSPAGATIHYIDPGVDTGDVIARRQVEVEPVDNGWTVHRKCVRAAVDLFKDTWPLIVAGTNERIAQDPAEATSHKSKEMDALDRLDLDAPTTAREVINLLRGRTYPPYGSAFFEHEGRRVFVRANLFYEEDLESIDRDDRDVLDWDGGA